VNILDLDRLPNGRPYIVMEYIAGSSLRDVVNAGDAPLGGVVHTMIEILLALDAAHRAGVIHRDLKPDNVMLTPVGRVKVLSTPPASCCSSSPPDSGPSMARATSS
jgi:serine/threonine-protein kinase